MIPHVALAGVAALVSAVFLLDIGAFRLVLLPFLVACIFLSTVVLTHPRAHHRQRWFALLPLGVSVSAPLLAAPAIAPAVGGVLFAGVALLAWVALPWLRRTVAEVEDDLLSLIRVADESHDWSDQAWRAADIEEARRRFEGDDTTLADSYLQAYWDSRKSMPLAIRAFLAALFFDVSRRTAAALFRNERGELLRRYELLTGKKSRL